MKVKKVLLSAFVIITFLAYMIHEKYSNLANTGSVANKAPALSSSEGSATLTYKNGTYTGPTVDVIYGLVQVQAVIQNGKIANVIFLQYPNDRQTSVMINDQVMPWLQQEAIQAQSANVNLITGATLTSEGFVNSLQAALLSAVN